MWILAPAMVAVAGWAGAGPITYNGVLQSDAVTTGAFETEPGFGRPEPIYYFFYGAAGNALHLAVQSADGGFSPRISIISGLFADSFGTGGLSEGLVVVSLPRSVCDGPWACFPNLPYYTQPSLDFLFDLPTTGAYTIALYGDCFSRDGIHCVSFLGPDDPEPQPRRYEYQIAFGDVSLPMRTPFIVDVDQVAEPESMALIGLGMAAVAATCRRRRTRSDA